MTAIILVSETLQSSVYLNLITLIRVSLKYLIDLDDLNIYTDREKTEIETTWLMNQRRLQNLASLPKVLDGNFLDDTSP